MKDSRKVTAIILIAGNSTRFGKNRNKNFEDVNGKEVLSYSLKAFEKNEYIDDMIIVAKENELKRVNEILEKEKYNKKIQTIIGGKDRKESVYHGLKTTDSDIVLIHDGARPMIKQDYINRCVESIGEYKGVTIGVKSKDTIKITNDENIVMNTTKRCNTWIIQTPQCFEKNILLKSHEKYLNEEVTDDCELLEKDNYEIKILEGDYTNIKVTTYEDIEIIRKFI